MSGGAAGPGAEGPAAARPEVESDPGFALYVHWPFCLAKCPYCDFNSHVASGRVEGGRWRRALLAELAHAAAATPGRRLASIFFGGGTPSLMEPDTAGEVVAAARGHWRAAADLEVTLEANPTSVEAGRLAAFRDAGVTRVSLGVQSLRDPDLRALGRRHDAAEARAALATAQRLFARTSLDLIYARQGQSRAAWRAELAEALALADGHVSLYQLTIEDGTAFGARAAAGRLRGLPDAEAAAAMYEDTQALCAAAGLPAYEISNHARPGAECRHNLVCWRGGEWAGIGPGAHGRIGTGAARRATERIRDPAAWLAAVEARGEGLAAETRLAPAESAEEYLLMSLRLAEGSETARYAALAGEAAALEARAAPLVADGLLWRRGGRIGATARGRILLDAILRALLA